jgi:small subunit ribosomal protein S3
MGQKVNPIGIRLGITRDWSSKWYAGSKTFASNIHTDFLVRQYLGKKLADASVSHIHIERAAKRANITIHTARPGIVIGKKGEDIEKLRTGVAKILGMTMNDVRLNIAEIRKPELDAKLVAEGISQQLEKRVMFRRAMKRAVTNTMRSGALGIKVRISGRLNGSEIARTETNREGRVPLHTFRADIDYGLAEAQTTYGVIGIKVWVYKGETVGKNEQPIAVPGSAPEEMPSPRKARKAPAPVGRAEATVAKPEGEAKKPKTATRARKKPAETDAAKGGEAPSTEAKAEGSTGEPAKPAAKAKTTVRRVTKKTGA